MGVGLLLIIRIRAYQSLWEGNVVIVSAPSFLWHAGTHTNKRTENYGWFYLLRYLPDEVWFTELHRQISFLKDNWPSFGQIESIDKLSKQELNCTLCFLNVLIDEFVNEKSACPNRVITRLVLIRIYVQNSMELMELKELQSEQEKSDGGK